MRTIYLAGGFRSGWQDRVIKDLSELTFLDPRTWQGGDELAYTARDLNAIDRCDVVLAYLEASNPHGYGLVFECGYAAARRIPILLVDEKGAADPQVRRGLGMVHAAATWDEPDLDAGVARLTRLLEAYS